MNVNTKEKKSKLNFPSFTKYYNEYSALYRSVDLLNVNHSSWKTKCSIFIKNFNSKNVET